jgi:hypothetical protein
MLACIPKSVVVFRQHDEATLLRLLPYGSASHHMAFNHIAALLLRRTPTANVSTGRCSGGRKRRRGWRSWH